jgi:VCBS repeat-containing protein
LTVYATNDAGNSTAASVDITISNVNDAPIATSISFTTNEDTVYTETLTSTDEDNDSVTYYIVQSETDGNITIESNGTFTYTPLLNSNGIDNFIYYVNDGELNSTEKNVTVTITAVNDAPKIDTTFSYIELFTDTNNSIDINISDVDGDSLTLTVTSSNTSIITVNENWASSIDQATYKDVSQSFILQTDKNATGIVQITINLADASLDANTSFDVNVSVDISSTLHATGQIQSYDADEEVYDNSSKDDGYYEMGKTRSYTRGDGNETVTDNVTGLIWEDTNVSAYKVWSGADNAADYCNDLNLTGSSDWRVPTISELGTLVDYSNERPAIDSAFNNILSETYWSSGINKDNSAWTINFRKGYAATKDILQLNYVLCVRGP